MRTVFLVAIGLIGFFNVNAQTDYPLSQQNFLHLANNPAEAGTTGTPIGTAVYGRQFNNLSAQSSSQFISAHSPIYERNIGLGLWVAYSSFFVTQRTDAYASYAYHIKNDDFILSMGIQAGFTQYKFNFSDLELLDPNDPAFGNDQNTGLLANTGIGIRLATDKFVAGAAIPRLIEHSLEDQGIASEYLEKRYINAYGFYTWEYTRNLALIPYLNLTFREGVSSLTIITGVMADVGETIQVGGYYQNQGRWTSTLGVRVNDNFRIGYAYNFGKTN